jgi:hypothetical protein
MRREWREFVKAAGWIAAFGGAILIGQWMKESPDLERNVAWFMGFVILGVAWEARQAAMRTREDLQSLREYLVDRFPPHTPYP